MSDCSRHKKEIAGILDMKHLAFMIGDLHYEALAELLSHLSDKLFYDSYMDGKNRRFKLSQKLSQAADEMSKAHAFIKQAWEISKPFMANNKNTQEYQ